MNLFYFINNKKVIKTLLRGGANKNMRDGDGCTRTQIQFYLNEKKNSKFQNYFFT